MQTVDTLETPAQGRVAVWSRRGFLTFLLVLVLAGLSGRLGVRTSTSTASDAGWSVSVEHATVARAGLDVPWQVTVHHVGGFGKEVTLAVTGHYFDIYETQGFAPEPSEATRTGEILYLTFAAPPADTFVVSYDAYVQPSSQLGRSGTVSVVDGGREVASVDIETALVP